MSDVDDDDATCDDDDGDDDECDGDGEVLASLGLKFRPHRSRYRREHPLHHLFGCS